MEDLRLLFAENAAVAMVISGLLIGLVFGAVVFRTNFCAMGSISDMMTFGDTRRFRAWLLAIAVAMIGSQWLGYMEVVNIGGSMYVGSTLIWFANIAGGFLFGFGMVFAGGCASRNVVRIGGGDLRAVFTLVLMGIFAYIAISGLIAPLRQQLSQAMSVEFTSGTTSLGAALAAGTGLDPALGGLVLACILGLAVIVICLADTAFRKSTVHIASGLLIGACIIAGWAATGLAYDEFAETPQPPLSLTFVRPSGDLLEWVERYTALGLPGFGVSTIIGAIIGSFVTALAMGRFRVQTFTDTNDTLRTMFGAALMGIGGVTAMGCTVGQALTGVSTLALGSFLAFGAIVAGGIAGVRALEWQLMREAEAA